MSPPFPCPYSAIHLRLSVGSRLQNVGGYEEKRAQERGGEANKIGGEKKFREKSTLRGCSAIVSEDSPRVILYVYIFRLNFAFFKDNFSI